MAWNRRWNKRGQVFILMIMTALLPLLLWAFLYFEQRGIMGDQNPILMIGLPFSVLIGLYWVRWWFLRPDYLNIAP
jgi:hypothetical protein